MFDLCSKLSSFPFELNAKLKYGFQISEQYRAVCVGDDYEYEEKKDGISDNKKDIGVCLTCIVSLDNPKINKKTGFDLKIEEGTCKSYDQLSSGDLVILKSRYAGQYGYVMNGEKSMSLIFWVNGPFDLKNRIF